MQVVPSPKATIRLAADYRAAMKATGAGQQLSHASFEGYIAARTLVDALKRAAAPLKPAAVQQALQSMSGHDLGGLAISFRDQAHGALNYGELSMIGRQGFFVR
jgi:branched-chain amino acid transport system substrate-binding protein